MLKMKVDETILIKNNLAAVELQYGFGSSLSLLTLTTWRTCKNQHFIKGVIHDNGLLFTAAL